MGDAGQRAAETKRWHCERDPSCEHDGMLCCEEDWAQRIEAANEVVRSASIKLGKPGTGKVFIGGHDISNAVRALALHASVDEVTRIELDLVLWTADVDSDEARVVIPQKTHDALVELGWTPPAEVTHG